MSFWPQTVIRRKRDGEALSAPDIQQTVAAISSGSMSDAQVGAFAMAVLLNGMQRDECVALTQAMAASGRTLDWSGTPLDGPRIDKHSTGGVGDKVSLMLAPVLAACGGFVPMISGRGLGHTGGTLDKLEAISGYQTQPSVAHFMSAVASAGCAIVGAGLDLAPADRRLYAIRDVSATVESAPLIVSSILAKKLAAGLDGLVMDVKTGAGSTVGGLAEARRLATDLVEVAAGAGLPVRALITDMNQVLGHSAGNSLELLEALSALKDESVDPRLLAVTRSLAIEALCLSGLATDELAASVMFETAISTGAAAEHFARMVAALGGPHDFMDSPHLYLEPAPVVVEAKAALSGTVTAIDVRKLGDAVIELGGGRRQPQDLIDPRVGLSAVAGIGASVGQDQPLALVHAASQAQAQIGIDALLEAFTLDSGDIGAVSPASPVIARIG